MKPHRNLTDRRSGRDRRFRDAAIPSPDRRNGICRRKSPRPQKHLHCGQSNCRYAAIKVQNSRYMPWI
jgi:hypothetical protein